jgi:hypothetical protein
MQTLKWFYLGVAAVAVTAGAGWAEELVVNGGFETGAFAPWVTDKATILDWGHSGDYCAGYFYRESSMETVTLRQDLARTVYPDEVARAELWAYGPPSYIFLAGATFKFYLGPSNMVTNSYIHDKWMKLSFQPGQITAPFNYIYITIEMWDFGEPPEYLQGNIDDISVTVISPTGVAPASLGRIKTLFR